MPATPFYEFTRSLFPAKLVRAHVPHSLLVWQPSVTPLSTVSALATAIALYLGLIFGLQAWMKNRTAFGKEGWFKQIFLLHNILLTLGSGLLLGCMLEEILPVIRERGLFYSICGAGAWTMRMETFYIVNYFFKYWELVDTVFLVLKKKKLEFLHVYHHSATAALCYSQLQGHTSVSWVVICLNLAVHVVSLSSHSLASSFPMLTL